MLIVDSLSSLDQANSLDICITPMEFTWCVCVSACRPFVMEQFRVGDEKNAYEQHESAEHYKGRMNSRELVDDLVEAV